MEKIKQFVISERGKNIMIVVIVILVGTGSFELGRLSKNGTSSGIKIEYPDQSNFQPANALSAAEAVSSSSARSMPTSNLSQPAETTHKNFFASSKGKKYYPVGCSAGKSLKMENRVYFATREEAEKAGYTLSASCK
ncbi:MAG TPA: hypothetical protein VGO63_00085 [Candidatus Paceibacterota bacterium]|jgi:hypothetical protein|nr:hypothetical protein [Candidatus Paceibacterota bacterium]